MPIDLEGIENSLIIPALEKLIEKDIKLINLEPWEECINHRLAVYLEQILRTLDVFSYHVDMEYDKRLDGEKDICVDGEKINIRPDILIHERGEMDNNLLVIEAKKGYPLKHDLDKIRGLMDADYHYDFGCTISYLPDADRIEYVLYYKSDGQLFWKRGSIRKDVPSE